MYSDELIENKLEPRLALSRFSWEDATLSDPNSRAIRSWGISARELGDQIPFSR